LLFEYAITNPLVIGMLPHRRPAINVRELLVIPALSKACAQFGGNRDGQRIVPRNSLNGEFI